MGTEEFWVPAVMAAVSAGAQYENQSQAQSRQNAADVQGIINQQQLTQKANSDVSRLTQQIAQSNPNKIQAQATGDYVSQLRKNAAGSMEGGNTSPDPNLFGQSVSAVGSVAGADPRFKQNLATDQTQVQDYGNRLAGEMGAMDAAVRQRQNEGLGMESLATQLGLLDAQSYGQNFVDSMRAQAAGMPNPWAAMGAQLLGRAAQAVATNWNSGKTPKLSSGNTVQGAQVANNNASGYYGTGG